MPSWLRSSVCDLDCGCDSFAGMRSKPPRMEDEEAWLFKFDIMKIPPTLNDIRGLKGVLMERLNCISYCYSPPTVQDSETQLVKSFTTRMASVVMGSEV